MSKKKRQITKSELERANVYKKYCLKRVNIIKTIKQVCFFFHQ